MISAAFWAGIATKRKTTSSTSQIPAPSHITRRGPQIAESVPENHDAISAATP